MNKEFFIVCIDGRDDHHTSEESAREEAHKMAEKLHCKAIVLKSVETIYPADITERVKSYEDACEVLEVEPLPEEEESAVLRYFTRDELAYQKLKVIAKALNQGWKPNWNDASEYKYYPWFYFNNGAHAGLASASTADAASNAGTSVGSRLCFKTRELATYAGKQFEKIYSEFMICDEKM